MKQLIKSIDHIVHIGPPGEYQIYSLSEAQQLLNLLLKLTYYSSIELQPIQNKLKRTLSCDPRISLLSSQYETLVRRWIGKVERLGCHAKDLWWVDIDIGEGYICWKYPEIRMEYFHYYDEEPSKRKKLEEIDLSPDLAWFE
jgi:hypothetical protein